MKTNDMKTPESNASEGDGSTQHNYSDGKPYLPTFETTIEGIAERLKGIEFLDQEDMAIHMVHAMSTNENVDWLQDNEVQDLVWDCLQGNYNRTVRRTI